jgi:predicted Zn-dependent protease
MSDRIEIFKQMLAAEPENTMVMFGLAKEYEKLGQNGEVIALLESYLSQADDEGNAYGMLAKAYEQNGERERARATYEKGIAVSVAHGHPSMASDYQMTLDLNYAE